MTLEQMPHFRIEISEASSVLPSRVLFVDPSRHQQIDISDAVTHVTVDIDSGISLPPATLHVVARVVARSTKGGSPDGR